MSLKSSILTLTFLTVSSITHVSSLHCHHCGWANGEEGGAALDCVLGTNIEDQSQDCADGWGDECITRVLKTATGSEDETEWTFRSCIGEFMTCEEGYVSYGDNGENQIWTSCCSEDHCNVQDPRDEISSESPPSASTAAEGLHCYHCGWAEESQGGEAISCIEGTGIEKSIDCGFQGWGDGCITRVVRDNSGEEPMDWYFRSCQGKNMACAEGYEEIDGSQLWTTCCNENNCNTEDPRDILGDDTSTPVVTSTTLSGLHCLQCGWAQATQGGAQLECTLGTDIEDTSVNCAAEGWGDGCITRVVKDITEEEERIWFLRSCIGKGMTCEEGYVDYEDQGEMWTTCCDEDNCNSDDPMVSEPAITTTESSSLHCYHCGWEDASEDTDCVLGTNLEDVSTDCEASGWGSECITRVLRTTTNGEETDYFFRSCIGANMICEEGYNDFGNNKLWTTCCSGDNCNVGDPRLEIETTTSTTTTTTTTPTTSPPGGLYCLNCGWAEESYGEEFLDCIQGTNLEDTSINCEASGLSSVCVTHVLITENGGIYNDYWYRSCMENNTVCEEGHTDFGRNQLWTTCCTEDNCNDGNPLTDITTSTTTTTTTTTTISPASSSQTSPTTTPQSTTQSQEVTTTSDGTTHIPHISIMITFYIITFVTPVFY